MGGSVSLTLFCSEKKTGQEHLAIRPDHRWISHPPPTRTHRDQGVCLLHCLRSYINSFVAATSSTISVIVVDDRGLLSLNAEGRQTHAASADYMRRTMHRTWNGKERRNSHLVEDLISRYIDDSRRVITFTLFYVLSDTSTILIFLWVTKFILFTYTYIFMSH
jgi:hypothetical protein